MIIKEIDIGWVAGVFEGEGWFVTPTEYSPTSFGAHISMTDFDVVRRLHDILGLGRLEGPRIWADRPTSKPQLKLAITKQAELKQFIEIVLPCLGERRSTRAQEVLAALAVREERREWLGEYYVCGHEKSDENTYHTNQNKTVCRSCSLENSTKQYQTKKAREIREPRSCIDCLFEIPAEAHKLKIRCDSCRDLRRSEQNRNR